jgi:hypothetical protein
MLIPYHHTLIRGDLKNQQYGLNDNKHKLT